LFPAGADPSRLARRRVPGQNAPVPGHSPPDQSAFFKLVLIVNLMARPFGRLRPQAQGLSLTEWRTLHAVAVEPGLAAAELTGRLGLDKMAVSRAVRALEAAGRLRREASGDDARRSALHLTAAGEALHAAIAPGGMAREAELLAGLNPVERAELNRLLDLLVRRARTLPE